MSIAPHPTPNPNARKYVLPALLFAQPRNFSSAAQASADPLAARLFALDGVYNVFFAQDFVTINKLPHIPWEPLETSVINLLAGWYSATQEKTSAP